MQNHELRGTKQVGNDYYWNFPSYLFELVDQKVPSWEYHILCNSARKHFINLYEYSIISVS